MTGDEKKKRDPIFVTCFVIFILAAVGVVGVFVDEHYLTTDDRKVAYGDKVSVDYIGTFYDYYGEKNAVVFDTSYSSIGNNDSVVKSNSFNKSSYSDLDFTVGGTDVLTLFGNAVVGHKIGDTIRVEVPNGYPAGSDAYQSSTTGLTVDKVQVMTSKQFEAVYDDIDLSSGSNKMFKTVFGWDATAYLDSTTQQVYITNMPESGKTYTYGSEDSEKKTFGTVTFNVRSIEGDSIRYDMSISDYTVVDSADNEIQMIELEFGTETWYITNYTNGSFTYKTCEETQNQTLYFEMTILSIE